MNKLSHLLIAFLLVVVVVLGVAVVRLYQRDEAGTVSPTTQPSAPLTLTSQPGTDGQGQTTQGEENTPSGGNEAGTELRCSVQLGALKIIPGDEFGLLEGDAADCETSLEDGVYTVSANVTHGDAVVVTVPEGISYASAAFTASGSTLTVENLDVQDLEATCERGTLHFSGHVTGDAEVEHLQGETVLELDGAPSDFNYQVSYELGHVQIGQQSFTGAKGSQSIDNHSTHTIRVHCAMGSAAVVFPQAS